MAFPAGRSLDDRGRHKGAHGEPPRPGESHGGKRVSVRETDATCREIRSTEGKRGSGKVRGTEFFADGVKPAEVRCCTKIATWIASYRRAKSKSERFRLVTGWTVVITLINYGAFLEPDHFLRGVSGDEKKTNRDCIGNFGDGMTSALAVLAREGVGVCVRSANFTTRAMMDGKGHVHIQHEKNKQDQLQVVFELAFKPKKGATSYFHKEKKSKGKDKDGSSSEEKDKDGSSPKEKDEDGSSSEENDKDGSSSGKNEESKFEEIEQEAFDPEAFDPENFDPMSVCLDPYVDLVLVGQNDEDDSAPASTDCDALILDKSKASEMYNRRYFV